MTPIEEPSGTEQDVLSSLPRTRPQRRSARRDAKPAVTATAAKPVAAEKPAATRKPAPAKRKPAAPKAPKAAPKADIPPAGFAVPDAPEEGIDVIGTAVQAVGEIAQIGTAVATKALKAALDRFPRP